MKRGLISLRNYSKALVISKWFKKKTKTVLTSSVDRFLTISNQCLFHTSPFSFWSVGCLSFFVEIQKAISPPFV